MIQETRINNWKNFCYEKSKNDPWGPVYRMIQEKKRNYPLNQIKKQNGNYTKNIRETQEELLDYFIKQDIAEEDTEEQREMRIISESDYTDNNKEIEEITEVEIQNILQTISNKKAPGPDNLSSLIWKKLHFIEKRILTTIFNKCIEMDLFPTR